MNTNADHSTGTRQCTRGRSTNSLPFFFCSHFPGTRITREFDNTQLRLFLLSLHRNQNSFTTLTTQFSSILVVMLLYLNNFSRTRRFSSPCCTIHTNIPLQLLKAHRLALCRRLHSNPFATEYSLLVHSNTRRVNWSDGRHRHTKSQSTHLNSRT